MNRDLLPVAIYPARTCGAGVTTLYETVNVKGNYLVQLQSGVCAVDLGLILADICLRLLKRGKITDIYMPEKCDRGHHRKRTITKKEKNNDKLQANTVFRILVGCVVNGMPIDHKVPGVIRH